MIRDFLSSDELIEQSWFVTDHVHISCIELIKRTEEKEQDSPEFPFLTEHISLAGATEAMTLYLNLELICRSTAGC